jgi:hypothetical protein
MLSDERHERIKTALSAYTRKITASAEEARKALVSEGIYTKSGKLAKNYSQAKTEKR